MKKIFTLIIGIVFSITILFAQEAPPQAFSFKATIKDKYGLPVVLKKINLRITILQGDMNGGTVYSEYFTPTTNLYSQVDVEIGRGNMLSGIFSSIDWSAHKYFLKVEVDPKGGTNYQALSTTQLLSVPYALYAGAAGNAFSGNYEDLFNKPALFDGTWSSLTGKPSFGPVALSGSWNDLINKPTTLAGYGIIDALSTSHAANGITATNITNWNTSFNWGNHSGLYRPISYVPAWSEIIGKPTFATVATSGSYNDLNNKPTIDGSETWVAEGTNVTITGVGTEANPYVINSTGGGGNSSHSIGETYGGGIVFYVYDNGQHGLIAATEDQDTGIGIRWFAGTYINTIALANGVGAGKANTVTIIANQGYGDGATYAARICNEYSVTVDGVTYGDWYLPSKYELNLLYLQKSVVGGFADDIYWSSTELNRLDAWSQHLGNGNQYNIDKYGYAHYVRAVRVF